MQTSRVLFHLSRLPNLPLILIHFWSPIPFAALVGRTHQVGLQLGPAQWVGDYVPAEGPHQTVSAGGQERSHTSEKVIENSPQTQAQYQYLSPFPLHSHQRSMSWVLDPGQLSGSVWVPGSCALCVRALDKYLLSVAIDVELKIEIYANFYFAISLFPAPVPGTWLMHHWRPR